MGASLSRVEGPPNPHGLTDASRRAAIPVDRQKAKALAKAFLDVGGGAARDSGCLACGDDFFDAGLNGRVAKGTRRLVVRPGPDIASDQRGG